MTNIRFLGRTKDITLYDQYKDLCSKCDDGMASYPECTEYIFEYSFIEVPQHGPNPVSTERIPGKNKLMIDVSRIPDNTDYIIIEE